jgi:uncharacterized membrane protein YgcG
LSRLRILAMFATPAVLAAMFAACGGSGDSSSEDPRQVIESATLKGVSSGDIDLDLQVASDGPKGGDLHVTLSGPFQSEGEENLPLLDLDASANGKVKDEAIDLQVGLILLSDRAYVNYEGTEYEVDPTTLNFIKSGLERSQGNGSEGSAADFGACQEAVAGLQWSDFAEGLKNEGSADVDGTSTTKLSGELNVEEAIDALIALTEDPACSAQLEAAGPLPLEELEKARGEVSGALKKSHVDLYVGDDDIVRKVAAEFTITPKDSKRTVEADLELTLGEVNEDQEISAPSGAKPLEQLFLKLGINPLQLFEEATSGDGLGSILESLGSHGLGGDGQGDGGSGGDSGGGSDGGSSSGGGSSGGSGGTAFRECLENAQTPVDLQNCASLQ